ncbi:class I SAM-dependent methyltransferase [Streptomyces sp. NPDC088846]|uniref:class I SAM-dependent methyltransferase n=1 Tax=Streptomyces sp. NPDC088846 TaxID=3365908 RepID=UPI0038216D6F
MTDTLPRMLPSPDGKPIPSHDTAESFRAFARDLTAGRRLRTPEAARFFSDLFDRYAASRDTGQATGRDDPLHDALARGGPIPHDPCWELGSGTGLFSPLLAGTFPTVISIDLSEQMLRRAAGRSPVRCRADTGALPAADGSDTCGAMMIVIGGFPSAERLSGCRPAFPVHRPRCPSKENTWKTRRSRNRRAPRCRHASGPASTVKGSWAISVHG